MNHGYRSGSVSPRSVFRVISIVMLLSFTSGCASGKVGNVRRYAANQQVPRPSVVLVYDFEAQPSNVEVDQPRLNIGHASGSKGGRLRLARVAAHTLSEELVKKVRDMGLPARRAVASTPVPLDAVMIKGQFVTVDEGDQAMRTVVGFGVGSGEVKAQFRAYQMTPDGPDLRGRGEVVAHGSHKPGMATPVAVAGATGKVVGVVVGAAATAKTESEGAIEADAKRAADAIAEELSAAFRIRGWIDP